MLFGKDYKHQSRHFQGFLTREQVEGLAEKLTSELRKNIQHSEKPILIFYDNPGGFCIDFRTNLSNLKLRLKRDERECSNLYVKISGNGDFKYGGILDIANFVHGEIAD